MFKQLSKCPPILILGGNYNALSIARSIGRRGIDIYMSLRAGVYANYTRYAKKLFPYPTELEANDFWLNLLLDKSKDELYGSVIFPCSDEAVEFVSNHKDNLNPHYILEDFDSEARLALLNKQKTIDLATSAEVPAPKYISISSQIDLDGIDSQVTYPAIVKPHYTYLFRKAFQGKKFFFVNNSKELHERLEQLSGHPFDVMICEFIPGPDNLLGSYYTYVDRDDRSLYHFTKKIIRRYPKNHGPATLHILEVDDEIEQLGRRFVSRNNLKGFLNVEFKKDLSDNQFKIIECNPRFTGANELLVRGGLDAAWIIYNYLIGLPIPAPGPYKKGLTLWFPFRDYNAYKELRALDEITPRQWFKSVFRKHVDPVCGISDPIPAIRYYLPYLTRLVIKCFNSVFPKGSHVRHSKS